MFSLSYNERQRYEFTPVTASRAFLVFQSQSKNIRLEEGMFKAELPACVWTA